LQKVERKAVKQFMVKLIEAVLFEEVVKKVVKFVGDKIVSF